MEGENKMAETPKTKLPAELEQKVKEAEKRLDSKPDAPKDAKKSDVAMPADALPKEVEADIDSFVKAESRANFEFGTAISAYMKKSLDKYGVAKDKSALMSGLKSEMVGAYVSVFGLSQVDRSALEAALTFGKGAEEGSGAALALHFRAYTGFNYQLERLLLGQKKLEYQTLNGTIMDSLNKSVKNELLEERKNRFELALNHADDKDLEKFRQIPIAIMKKLGLEDQIEKDSFRSKSQIGEIYGKLLEDYAQKNRSKYLN